MESKLQHTHISLRKEELPYELAHMRKGIWISWEIQRRNKGISSALFWPLHEIVSSRNRFFRYLYSSYETLKLLYNKRTPFVVVQNPSIILASLAICLKFLIGYKILVDTHNSGLIPLGGRSIVLMAISKWLQRHADLTIVTNSNLKKIVELNRGRAFVLPDRMPEVPATVAFPLEGKYNIACISTFKEDEPYRQIIDASRLIPPEMFIYFTGQYQGKIDVDLLPLNVKLVGFIPEPKYWSLLNSVDAIIDLTLRDDCLVCGAYEGIAVGKPLILSRTEAIMDYFRAGCIYVDPKPTSIAAGIQTAFDQFERLSKEIVRLKDILAEDWEVRINQLIDTLNSLY